MAKVNFIRKHTKAEVATEPIVDGNFIVTGEGNVFIDYGEERIEIISSGGSITGDTLPIGSITAYGKETAPDNWLICDGRAVNRTAYADLFAVIGTKYGEGDGSTTFNLPNLKGRVPVGLDGSDTDFNAIGKTGGEKTHTFSVYELPTKIPVNYGNISGGSDVVISSSVVGTGGVKSGQANMNISATGQAFSILSPYETENFIIKAFQSAGVVASVVNTQTESDTNVYSCNYVNNLNTYSTEEKRVGTWIDGKPLYRKTITFKTFIQTNKTTSIKHNIENAKNIFIDLSDSFMEANIGESDYISYNLPLISYAGNITDKVYCYVDLTNINFYSNGAWAENWTKHITLNYTKTTD